MRLSFIHCRSPLAVPAQDKGAKVDEKYNNGWTALMFAAYGGHEEVVEFLVVRGVGESDVSEMCVGVGATDLGRA
jgi:ankyrin repeat protein